MKHLQGLHVLILGLGDSGLAMARWCARCHAARIVVADTRADPPQAAILREQVPQAELHLGGFDVGMLDGIQLLLKSPGLAPGDAQVAPLLARAAEQGVSVQGELSLFASALADLKDERGYAPKVVAITGTNGKTTTTSLTARLIERSGWRVGLAGNIGPTMLDTLASVIDLEPPPADEPVAADASLPAGPAEADESVESLDKPVDDVPDGEGAAVDVSVEEAPTDGVPAEVAVDDGLAAGEDEQPSDVGGGPPPHLIPPPPPGPEFVHLPQAWVLELSSFQLDGITNFEPTVATVLNVTQDHLDWHGSMDAYAAAKARIFGRQGILVINEDDPLVGAMIPAPIPGKGRFAKPVQRKVVRFGLEVPAHPGDFGLVVEGGMAWLVRAMERDETVKRKKGEDEEIFIQRLMPADALRIRGRHNTANALAALALATAIGRPLAPMLHGLREYPGEPHRVEYIGTIGGVEAFDDSKGTNVGATVAALEGLGIDRSPARIAVVLGGDGKGQDFSPLHAAVARHARAVALIGKDAAVVEAALQGVDVPMARFDTLEAATRWCFERAHAGDSVLLSPACASLDMFRNYAHRAQVFVDTVRELAAERGETLS